MESPAGEKLGCDLASNCKRERTRLSVDGNGNRGTALEVPTPVERAELAASPLYGRCLVVACAADANRESNKDRGDGVDTAVNDGHGLLPFWRAGCATLGSVRGRPGKQAGHRLEPVRG